MFMPPVFPAHWHVSQPVLIADTFSSLVWKVSLPDGTPAIVKGLKPIEDIADELRGADYLVWRNGRGAVRLLGRENNLMLLEYAGERMLSHIVAEHGDYQATEIAAELMAKLYAASEEPLPSALLPIRDRFAALFQRARDDQNAGCQTDYVHAAIIADQMMSNASELRGLHGDLHHENIMFSSRGWLVIDPVGLVGEVGFGAANMFVGFPCSYDGYKALEQRAWVKVTAKVGYKFHNIYRGKGPVLTALSVEPAEKPLNDVVTFS